jgi:VCBS repeat-containing protein
MSDGIHVMHKGDLWVVTRGNYTLDEFKSEKQAVQLAKQRARASRAVLTVHAEDGSVRTVESFQQEGKHNRARRAS